MSRISARSCALGLTLLTVPMVLAQNAEPPAQDDLRAIRQLLEQQSKQLETLTQQVTQLSQKLDAQKAGTASAAPSGGASSAAGPATPPSPPTVAPGGSPVSGGVPEPAGAKVDGAKHVVAKGETLTSIAKRYNIAIADLQSANNIKDDRKLQIGQTLTIPSNPKPSESSTEKKENP